jgi:hypothetical protein
MKSIMLTIFLLSSFSMTACDSHRPLSEHDKEHHSHHSPAIKQAVQEEVKCKSFQDWSRCTFPDGLECTLYNDKGFREGSAGLSCNYEKWNKEQETSRR